MVTKIAIILCLLALHFQVVYMQECQQITVCGNGASGRANAQKGDIGAPGKAGAPGSRGSKGDVGAKGESGEACTLGGFEEEIRREFAELKRLVSTPASCSTSPVHGRQKLRSGEDVYCDGGWRVFQKRQDGSVSFDKDWTSYKSGFGNLDGEFWLGLDKIHNLTRSGGCKLRVDLWGFDGDHAFAHYSSFSVEDEDDSYRLHATGYSGTAGDSLGRGPNGSHNGQRFSTKDRDNDNRRDHSCSNSRPFYAGGWWFDRCYNSVLNARWGESSKAWDNIMWRTFKGAAALKETTMKLRCD